MIVSPRREGLRREGKNRFKKTEENILKTVSCRPRLRNEAIRLGRFVKTPEGFRYFDSYLCN
ncbi:MAG: hypothetical protein CRN43_03820 [Candidatus Nephrothrix sp. EaCA]|nr:MAG: hypothetical protein CRN43_03820 [Candidatus Nephrothrix sp. EaCA]